MKMLKKTLHGIQKLWKEKKWWIIGILVVLAFVVNRFYSQSKNKVVLNFTHPQKETLVKTLEVSGVIDAKEKASLRFAAGGKVVYLGAQEGDMVKKGQTLATIDQSANLKAQEKNLNLYSKERLDWEERQDDIKDETINKTTQRTVSKEQYDLNNTVLDVELTAITIANGRMTSPFDGMLVKSPLTVTGVQLLATDAFEVVNPKTLIFRTLVDESDIALVEKNQTAEIQLDAYPDTKASSGVSYISFQSVPSSSGTAFIVEFPLQATDLSYYRLGMNGDAKITLETRENVLSIPLISLKEKSGKSFVDVKTAKGTEEREVTLGMETDEKVEILSGLSESDEVVVPE